MNEPSTGRQAEEWLRSAESGLGIGFWSYAVGERKFTASPGLSDMLGLQAASVQIDLSFFESLVHPEDRLILDSAHCLAVDDRQSDRNFRLIRPDGQLRWLRSRARKFFDRTGALTKVVTVVVDVTEDHMLRVSADNMRALLNVLSKLMGSAFWICAPGGQLIERFNADDDMNLMGKVGAPPTWRNVVHEDDAPNIPASWEEAYRKGYYRISVRMLMRDGAYRLLHAAGLPFDTRYSTEGHWGGISTADERILSKAKNVESEPPLLTPGQMRACRALLDWNAEFLANKAGISISTVRRLESNEVSPGQGESMRQVMTAFREAGLKVIHTQDGRFCVTDTR